MPMMRILLALVIVISAISPATAGSADKIIIKPNLSPEELNSGTFYGADPGIGLAISGGGARGLAVIGILKVLEREHIKVKLIAGVSIGSIIGGLYSCGYSSDEIERIAYQINWSELLATNPMRKTLLTTQKGQSEKSLFKLRFQGWRPVVPQAITSAQRLSRLLDKLTARGGIRSGISFDYLNPPLRVVCTDLLTGERVVLSSGSLPEALRASMAVPVAFTPAEIGGRLLVDGGLVDPIPVDVVLENAGHPVVAINVTSDLLPRSQINNVVGIADQTTTIMAIDKKQALTDLADLCITPDLRGWTATDFSHIDSLIEIGERAAEEAIPAIRELLADKKAPGNSDSAYAISQTQICDLRVMPKSYFNIVDSSALSYNAIEYNLNRACVSGYIKEAWAELIPDSTGTTLDYHLIDNPRIEVVRFIGATIFPSSELYSIITGRPGAVLNTILLGYDKQALENHYIKAGYNLARANAEFDTSYGSLTFMIDEGRINDIKIEGNRKTRNYVITRHLPFKAGDIFRQDEAEKGIDGVFSTGLFETARMVAVPDSSGITLLLKVKENRYNFIRGGARYDLEHNAQAFLDFVAGNVFGGGQEIYISTNIGEKRRGVSLNYRSDRIFKTLFTNTISADLSELKRNSYSDHKYTGFSKQISYGARIAPGRQFPQLGMISIVGELRKYEWDEPGKTKRQEFSKIGIGFESIVDTRDAISFPRTGKYHYFDLQFAGDLHSEKSAYTRFETSIEAYYPLTERLNFHPRLVLGASSDILPYFDQFSLGGLGSFVGLYQDELLGDKMVLGSVELRQRIGGRFYMLARYNAGNMWNNLERVRLSHLLHGAGIGLGLRTPVGPIQAWYGRVHNGFDLFYLDMGYSW
jgi:NTE family protein